MRLAIKRNAQPLGSAEMKQHAAELSAAITEDVASREAVEQQLAELVGDPDAYGEAVASLELIDARLGRNRRTLASIQAAIPAAAARERAAELDARRDQLERETLKLMRTTEAKYREHAAGLAAVLHDMEHNERAWDALGEDYREEGLSRPDNHTVEFRLRRSTGATIGSFSSVLARAFVENWEGGHPLFRGRKHR